MDQTTGPSTSTFSKDEMELISPAVKSVGVHNGMLEMTILARKCFGQPINVSLLFSAEAINKMAVMVQEDWRTMKK